MKGNIKIYSIVFVICLFMVSFAYAYTQGTTNANIEYLLVSTDETGTGVYYQNNCLFECHMVIKMKYSGLVTPASVSINPKINSNFIGTFNKINNKDDIAVTDVRILQTENYNYYDAVCNPYTIKNANNTDVKIDNCTDTKMTGSRNVWNSVYNGFALNKDSYTYIDIVGSRKASLNSYHTDYVPTIYGYAMSELAWWDSTWAKKRIENVTNNAGGSLENIFWLVNQTSANQTNKGGISKTDCASQTLCQDFRAIKGDESGTTGYQIPYCNTTTPTLIWRGATSLPTGNTTFYLYYNNSGASAGNTTSPINGYLPANISIFLSPTNDGTTSAVNWATSHQNGSLVGSIPIGFGSVALYGSYYQLDGSTRYIYFPTANGDFKIGAKDDVYFALAFKTSTTGLNQRIISRYASGDTNGLNIRVNTTNMAEFSCGSNNNVYVSVNRITVTDNKWHTLVWVHNVSSGRITMYIDRQLVANTTNGNALCSVNTDSTGNLYFGGSHFGSEYFNGQIGPIIMGKNLSLPNQFWVDAWNSQLVSTLSTEINTPVSPSNTETFLNVSVSSPKNASYVGNNSVWLEYVINKINMTGVGCNYKLDAGTNITMTNCANTTISLSALGDHTIIITVNGTNSTGTFITNTSTTKFTITNTNPSITINSPGNTTYAYNNSVFLQFLVTHSGGDSIDKCWYKLDANANVTGCNNVSVSTLVNAHTITVCANDSWNDGGCATIGFTINSPMQELNVTVGSPSNASYVGNTSIILAYTTKSVNITTDKCWYKLDSGANTTLTSCLGASLSMSALGDHIIILAINGTKWNSTTEFRNETTIKYTITNVAPTVNRASPGNTTYIGNQSVYLQFYISHSGADVIDKCWYKVDAVANVTTCANTTLTGLTWGLHTVVTCANDSWDKITCDTISFSLINVVPSVAIQGISNATYIGNSTFNNQFTITHTGIDSVDRCWYKLDSGANVTGCTNTTVSVGLGFHTYTVCSNDSYDAIGCSQLNFSITNIAPSMLIDSPGNTTYYGNETFKLQFTVTHSGVDAIDRCWYSYDSSANVTGCGNTTIATNRGSHKVTVCTNDSYDAIGCSQLNFTIISVLTVYAYNEETLASLGAFNVTITNEVDFSTSGSAPNGNVAFNISAEGTIKVIVSNTEYETRSYYLAVTNNTILNAYLIKSGNSYPQQFLTKDIYDSPLSGAYITIMKWINTTWTTVSMAKSDDSGSVSLGLVHGSNYYVIASLTGYNNKTRSFMPSTIPIIFVFGMERIPNYVNWLKGNIEHSCQTDVTARTVNCTINDTIGIVLSTQLVSWRRIGMEWTSFCSPTDSSAPYFMNCTMESANRTYYYTLFATTDNGIYPIESAYMDYHLTVFDYGVMGLLLLFILFLSVPMIARWNPAVAVALSIGVIVMCYWIEFFNVSESAIVSIVLVGGIVIMLLSRRET